MIYEIILEDEKKNYDMIDYLQETGDFLFYNSRIILHTKKSKKSISEYIKNLFGNKFEYIIKKSECKDVISYPKIAYSWYAQDVATLNKKEIEKYKKEALSIYDELAEKVLEMQQKGGVQNE